MKLSVGNMAKRSTGLLILGGKERGIVLRGRITKTVAACCIARLVVLAAENKRQPILLRIDSPGGPFAESLPIISTMEGVHCPLATFCSRDTATTAVVIAACGRRGYRTVVPGAKLSFLPLTGDGDDLASDQKFLHVVADILSKRTGNPPDRVLGWISQGASFSAQQAVANGLVDAIASKPVLPPV